MSDVYEEAHMSEDGMIYRDKFVAGWPLHAVMALATLASLLPLVAIPVFTLVAFLSSILPAAFIAAIWLMFSVLRVSVSTSHVYIQLGLFGPKIEVASIESAEVVAYDWKKYGGWGIRYGTDGSMAYNFMSDAGRAVEITYRNESGKEKKVVVSSREPERLAQAIAHARAEASDGSGVVLDLEEEVVFEEAQQVQNVTSDGS